MVFAKFDTCGSHLNSDGKPSTRKIFLARRLDSELLAELGAAADGELLLIGQAGAGTDTFLNKNVGRSVWSIGEDRLAVAWPAYDAAGNMLGYFQAKFSIVQKLN